VGSGQTDVPLPCRPRIRHGRRHRPAPCRDRSRESGRVAQPSAGPFDGCDSEGAATDVVTVPYPGRVRLDDRGRLPSGTAGRGTWLTIPERPPLRVRGQLPASRRAPSPPRVGGRPRGRRRGRQLLPAAVGDRAPAHRPLAPPALRSLAVPASRDRAAPVLRLSRS